MKARIYTSKRRTNLMTVITVAVPCLLLVAGNPAFATPYLQLDANPATYVSAPEESTVTAGPVFTLYALVNSARPNNDDPLLSETYYISAAIVPSIQPKPSSSPNLGSYIFDGDTINVTEHMVYGTPPVDTVLNKDQLAAHGIFDTYYYEHAFNLDNDKRIGVYNVQDDPGDPGQFPPNPDGPLYYQDFYVDASGLASGYFLHFDLYTKGSPSIDQFAPFSHDLTHAPVPGAVLLGMLGLGVVGLKLRKFA